MSELGVNAPADYVDQMARHDGIEGFLGGRYLQLFSLDEISELNRERWEDMPWLVHFGGDGSNGSYAFDKRSPQALVLAVDLIDHDLIETVGDSLAALVEYVLRGEARSL
jgi:hypothetical protein